MKKKEVKIKPKYKELTIPDSKRSLYEKDFYAWIYKQVNLLQNKEFDKLDMVNLIEEIESLGRSYKKSLQSHLTVLIQHILKNTFTPDMKGNSRSWDVTIFHTRKSILKLIKESPSLKGLLPEILEESFRDAREYAIIETGSSYIREDLFPEECPWTLNEILSDAT